MTGHHQAGRGARINWVHKIGLGTVQWGSWYGIANRTGRPDAEEIRVMLKQARHAGVSVVDTAHVYGEAEQILGELNAKTEGFRLFTKTLPLQADPFTEQDAHAVSLAFSASLERLRCKQVDGLLVHNAENLLASGCERLWEFLQGLKADKLVRGIGVSACYPELLRKILDRFVIDIVQIPFNIYDQRFAQTGILRSLKQSGIEVHARSPFLQGLLLLPPEQLPSYFDSVREHQRRLHRNLTNQNQSLVGATLRFCLMQSDIDHVVVGCETLAQLQEILDASSSTDGNLLDLTTFALNNEDMLDPSRWVV